MLPEPTFDPEALRAARLAKGLAQSQLARLIDAPGGDRVSKWELGVQAPRPAAIRKLAEVLNVTTADLLKPGPTDLRRLRILRGLSAVELAAKVHIAATTWMHWEEGLGVELPDPAMISALADALDVAPAVVVDAFGEARRRYRAGA